MTTEQQVLDALRGIRDPDSQKDIVTLGLVRDVAIDDGAVSFTLAFTGQTPRDQGHRAQHGHARSSASCRASRKVQVKMGGGRAAAAPPAHAHGHAHGQATRTARRQRPAAPPRGPTTFPRCATRSRCRRARAASASPPWP